MVASKDLSMASRQVGYSAAGMVKRMAGWKGSMDYWMVGRKVPMDVLWVLQWGSSAQTMVDD